MARDSSGSKNQPIYLGTGGLATGPDLTEIAQYASDVGNRKSMTDTARQALSGINLWVGLAVHATDTTIDWLYTTAGWRITSQDTGWQAITLNSGWTAQSPDAIEYRVVGGMCTLSGRLDATGGAGTTAFTLPVGARPSRAMNIAVFQTSGSLVAYVVNVATTGVVTVFKAAAVVDDLPLTGVPPFPVA